jgi:hypothetical protein
MAAADIFVAGGSTKIRIINQLQEVLTMAYCTWNNLVFSFSIV